MRMIAEKVKERLPDIQTVMTMYGVDFNIHGAAICPFHKEKTASLKCKNGHYKCFGCGASGDAIGFVQQYFGLGFLDAVKRLNADFRLNLLDDGQKTSYSEIVRAEKKRRQQQAEREAFEAEYSRKAEEHRRLHYAYTHAAPQHPGDAIGDEYAEACQRLPYLEWWFETHPFFA